MTIDTKEALLDAGEKLFAEGGFTALSVRAVTKEAGANLGAVTYHFGTKGQFVEEIFLRRLRPMYQQCIARLDALDASLAGNQPTLEEVIEIFVRSIVDARGAEDNGVSVLRLTQQGMQDLPPEIKIALAEAGAEFQRRTNEALLRALPDVPPAELFWRHKFFLGALSFGVDAWASFDPTTRFNFGVAPTQLDHEALIQRLVAFICAGMRAA
jgi:AcrR family transcriptional regulator